MADTDKRSPQPFDRDSGYSGQGYHRADEDATFPVTFRIDEDGLLRAVDVSGPFYGPNGMVDYTVDVDDYGTDQDISPP